MACQFCVSPNVDLVNCVDCNSQLACNICNEDYMQSIYQKHSNDYEGSELNVRNYNGSLNDCRCESCYLNYANKNCNRVCSNCEKRFQSPDDFFRSNYGIEHWNEDNPPTYPRWVLWHEDKCKRCAYLTHTRDFWLDAIKTAKKDNQEWIEEMISSNLWTRVDVEHQKKQDAAAIIRREEKIKNLEQELFERKVYKKRSQSQW